jgi:hypothetical protein
MVNGRPSWESKLQVLLPTNKPMNTQPPIRRWLRSRAWPSAPVLSLRTEGESSNGSTRRAVSTTAASSMRSWIGLWWIPGPRWLVEGAWRGHGNVVHARRSCQRASSQRGASLDGGLPLTLDLDPCSMERRARERGFSTRRRRRRPPDVGWRPASARISHRGCRFAWSAGEACG